MALSILWIWVFLVEKGHSTGQPISIRGTQKRMEYYASKGKLHISCHHLRHTMATQLLNADADLCTIQIWLMTIRVIQFNDCFRQHYQKRRMAFLSKRQFSLPPINS